MSKLEKTTLKNLIREMEIISKLYFTKNEKRVDCYLSDSDAEDRVTPHDRFVSHVEEAYMSLNPLEQLMINNDFFYEEYPDWWKDLFSLKSYNRVKRNAIVHFLKVFYEE